MNNNSNMNNNNNEEYLLVVKGLKKSFSSKSGVVKAVDDVSFSVKPGEIMGLIGESGSGKTTVGRLLIRLYENFSGYVSLDNQIISGKKISKKRSLFLHKNVQMIFQDPHASLDEQQNVYSILKEPLVVNKIMKYEYEDIFTDWKSIIKNFKYSFQKRVKNIEYSNIKALNDDSLSFIKEWKNELPNLKFDFSENKIDNIFNSYFSYLDSRQSKESYYVKKAFSNNESLLKAYFEYQKDYRNNNLNSFESKLKNNKEKLDLTVELSTQSLNKYLTIKERNKLKNKIMDEEKSSKEYILNVKNMLLSYLLEYKNSYLSFNEKANKTTNYIKYNEFKKEFLVYRHAYKQFSKNINKLLNLTLKNVDELINSLNESISNLQKTLSQLTKSDPKYIDKVKEVIYSEFDFNVSSFINMSFENKRALAYSITQQKKSLDEKSKKIKIKSEPHKTNIDILSAKKDYQNTLDELKWNLQIYLQEFNSEMKLLEEDILAEKEKNKNLKPDLIKLDLEFDQAHKKFLKELEEFFLKNGLSKERVKQLVNFYDSKVLQKKESLKSFDIEVTNLKSDFIKLKHLVGIIQNKLSKQFIKKILLKEKIYKSLEEVGLLRQFAWRYPHEFSGGQRQRIVIARAIISEPRLIIADEPIASLDISIQAQVVNLLKTLCKNKNVALIFIAHDLSMVEYIADKINIMHLGKIVEYGETSKVYDNPIHPYTINLFNSIPKISNANKPFEASSFELKYLEEQKKHEQPTTWWKCEDEHYVYSTKNQYKKWMGLEEIKTTIKKPIHKTQENSAVWKKKYTIEESIVIDVKK